ncbi:Immunoglobulin [Oryctes borbonicus]|uniref:Immunoglobulin n=1 Tax=Oryctes borbonicus TaxID=1629725 RepID=A0A0T6BFB4_9SCAR|nr:Immunoglobulin [Oryctes borbonicus]
MTSKVSLVFLATFIVVMGEMPDWSSQCDRCKCKWSSGKKSADCRNSSYNTIPGNLSNELRDIDFSNNPLYELKAREFANKNLSDVHKLKLVNCNLHDVNYKAFEGLSLLIELDLSDNKLTKLNADVFKSNSKLRIVFLSNNEVEYLPDGLFGDKTHLQKVHLNNNKLSNISGSVFGENCSVNLIDLSNNRLKTLDGHFLDNFSRLTSITLEGNPWVCDCHLSDFRNISISKNLVTSYTVCEEPSKVKGQLWNDPQLVFACTPEIIEPNFQEPIDVTSSNFTISCKVKGVPTPDIEWVTNGRIIDRDPRQSVQKYITTKTKQDSYVWNNLTIINFNYRDKGEYKCVAKNPGGITERNVTLLISGSMLDGTYGGQRNYVPLIIGLLIGALVLLIFIFVLIYCCCRRTGRDTNVMAKNRSLSQSNEFVSLDGHHEMGKALITEVNPIVKPPRQQSVPASVISGGTEVSETKKMLDEDSIYGDEESRSLDFDRYQTKPPNNLNIDYRGESHFPPDLLPFTHRTMPQVSPAGSSASTVVADAARLPAHHGPQSPIQPPFFDAYRTLPYSRSHSPFTPPHSAPIRIPRQGGYVTVPRRPRQSWSSETPTSDIGEPLYDNLGLRTTATGSSVLSLNRIGDNTPKTSTPKAGNIRPTHPLSPNMVSIPCDPIAEHDSPPMAQTLPRSISAHRALSPNVDAIRANWTRSPEPNDSRRESTASLLPTPDGKAPKIPPRPPPKPKKRTSTGPLFEDEGEDGTEV